MLSLVLAEPNIIHLAYREGGNGLTLHVLTRVGAVGRSDGADDHFGAASPRTLFHLPGLLTSPPSPCLTPALLKSRFFSLCLQHRNKQSTAGRWKALRGAGGSGLVFLPLLIRRLWNCCLREEQGWGLTGERRPCLLLRACCLPRVPALLPLGSGCSHLLQASFGLPVLLPGAGAVLVPSRLRAGGHPSLSTSTLCAPTSGPAAPPRAKPFSRRS